MIYNFKHFITNIAEIPKPLLVVCLKGMLLMRIRGKGFTHYESHNRVILLLLKNKQ